MSGRTPMFSMYGEGGNSGVEVITSARLIRDTVMRKKLSVKAVALNPTTLPPAPMRPHPENRPAVIVLNDGREHVRAGRGEFVDQHHQRLLYATAAGLSVKLPVELSETGALRPRCSL